MNVSAKDESVALILVDHGSRRRESNEMLHDVATLVRKRLDYAIVEIAHMELAEPSIESAYRSCVDKGAKTIIVHPFFLFPGRHWSEDIPRLVSEIAVQYPETRFLVSAPLGAHDLMADIINDRIENCLASADEPSNSVSCPFCFDSSRCHWHSHPSNQ